MRNARHRELLGADAAQAWEAGLESRRVEEDSAREYSGIRYGDVFAMKV